MLKGKTIFKRIAGGYFLLACILCPLQLRAQISERNYLKDDSVLWNRFDIDCDLLYKKHQSGAINDDSLSRAWEELYDIVCQKNVDLALKYATVPSGLHRVYMVRDQIAKSLLEEKLSILPDSLKDNKYADYIRKYIDSRQIKTGEQYIPFECQTADGNKFDWKLLSGKSFLLVFDGLYCMGENGRNYLEELMKKADNDKFQLIVYIKCRNLESLAEEQKKFPQFKLISDFQQEGSTMNIVYNCQASPTCFMIDHSGKLQFSLVGVEPKQINEYLEDNACMRPM